MGDPNAPNDAGPAGEIVPHYLESWDQPSPSDAFEGRPPAARRSRWRSVIRVVGLGVVAIIAVTIRFVVPLIQTANRETQSQALPANGGIPTLTMPADVPGSNGVPGSDGARFTELERSYVVAVNVFGNALEQSAERNDAPFVGDLVPITSPLQIAITSYRDGVRRIRWSAPGAGRDATSIASAAAAVIDHLDVANTPGVSAGDWDRALIADLHALDKANHAMTVDLQPR